MRPTRAIQPYEGAPPSPADLGQALQVDAVIDPRFHQTPDGLTVSAQLVRSRDGVRLWSGHFEHEPRRPEVYEQAGRGRSHLLSASLVEMPKAEAAFQAAIELDPTYAAAHAGLALACCAQAELRATPVAEAYAKAKAAALRALAMDDTCGDAQVALGAVLFLSEWDWMGAEVSRAPSRSTPTTPTPTCCTDDCWNRAAGWPRDSR